jgi:hypothetical protein
LKVPFVFHFVLVKIRQTYALVPFLYVCVNFALLYWAVDIFPVLCHSCNQNTAKMHTSSQRRTPLIVCKHNTSYWYHSMNLNFCRASGRDFPYMIFWRIIYKKRHVQISIKVDLSPRYLSKSLFCRFKKNGYQHDMLQRSACLVINPYTVDRYAYLFGCTTVAGV